MSIYLGSALLLWLAIFNFNFVPFPLLNPDSGDYGRPCYSPNHEYYIERYTTPFQSLFIIPSHSKPGFAILYDKTGKELYRGSAYDIYKPGWFGDKVGFFGGWGPDYYEPKLPSSAGDRFIGCVPPESKN